MKSLSKITLITLLSSLLMLVICTTASAQVEIPIYGVSVSVDHGNYLREFVPVPGVITKNEGSVRVQVPDFEMDGIFELELVNSVEGGEDSDSFEEYTSSGGTITIAFIYCPINNHEYVIIFDNVKGNGLLFETGGYFKKPKGSRKTPLMNL